MILNTGKPRSVVGHAVSGAFFALILNAANSLESGYNKAFADDEFKDKMPSKDAEFSQKNGENSQKSGVLARKKGEKSGVLIQKNHTKDGKNELINAQNSLENGIENAEFSHKKGKKSTAKALIKASLEGGIIAASGIAAANALGDKRKSPLNSTLSAIFCVGAGVAGLYALNQLLNGEKFTLLNSKKQSPK